MCERGSMDISYDKYQTAITNIKKPQKFVKWKIWWIIKLSESEYDGE